MTRIKATLSNLILSSIVFSLVVFVVILLWYPEPHFTVSGGWQGLEIVASINLILGPLLTFIVYDSHKPKKIIIGDLSVIAFIQFATLIFGVNTIYNQRPLAVVYWEDSFYVVPASALVSQQVDADDLAKLDQGNPVFIYAEKPQTISELKLLIKKTENDKIPPYQQVNLYRPLQPNFQAIKLQQVDIHEIIERNAEMKADLMAIIKTKKNIDDYVYIPLLSKYQNIILLFNQQGEWVNQIVVPSKND